MRRPVRQALSAIFAAALAWAPGHAGTCGPGIINPITDIAWQCVFPVRIGGVLELGADVPDDPEGIGQAICVCRRGALATIGLSVSFWEPARLIDTVHDAWCFNAAGLQLDRNPGMLDGTHDPDNGSLTTAGFAQAHWYIFPVWAVLDLFTDLPCLENQGFDLAMVSELVPTWNDSLLALILNPEAILFANPAAVIACAADAAAVASGGLPLDELFWCMGSWGNAYPLSGHTDGNDYVELNAALAARAIYAMGRTALLLDPGVDHCAARVTPIWRKRNYRLQALRPVRDHTCRAIGEPGLTWTQGKNPLGRGDNFTWMLFRKVRCCIGWTPGGK